MHVSGFIALYRSMLKWAWHDDPATLSVFVHLLLMANHAAGEWHGIRIERGQLISGRKALSEMTGLSEQNVRTALTHLKSTGEITITSTNKFSLITIVNYGKFQDFASDLTSRSTSNLTNDQPAANQQSTTNNNKKQGEQEGVISAPEPKRSRFTPPTIEEVTAYCLERGNGIDAQRFFDFYEASGWRRGKTPIKDWRACVRTWERQNTSSTGKKVTRDADPYADIPYG